MHPTEIQKTALKRWVKPRRKQVTKCGSSCSRIMRRNQLVSSSKQQAVLGEKRAAVRILRHTACIW